MKTPTKEEFEKAIGEVIYELEKASPWMTYHLIEGIRKKRKCSIDEAIREFATFQVTLKKLLRASEKSSNKSSS